MNRLVDLMRDGELDEATELIRATKAEELLEKVDEDGNTFLHYAVTSDAPVLVQALLEKGLSVLKRNRIRQGSTALSVALSCHAQPEIIRLLVDSMPVDARKKGFPFVQTALQRGAELGSVQVLTRDCTREELNGIDSLGRNLIYAAVENGSSAAVLEHLLQLGLDPNRASSLGFTPLYLAIFYGARIDFVSRLLRFGADPYKQSSGLNALALASKHQKLQLTRFMETASLMTIMCTVRSVPRLAHKSQLKLVPRDVIRLLASYLFLLP
jgi:hypothetical protein